MVDDASDNETYVMTLLTKDGLIVSNRCHIGVGALSWPKQIEKEVFALQIVNLIKVNDDIYIDMATYIIKRSDAPIERTLFCVSTDIFAMHMSTLPSEYYYCSPNSIISMLHK